MKQGCPPLGSALLPANWRELSAGQLVAELERMEGLLPRASRRMGRPLAERALELLTGGAISDPDTRRMLLEVAQRYLSDQQRAGLLAQVDAQAVDAGALSLEQLQERYAVLEELRAPADERAGLVQSWLSGRALDALSPEALGWIAPRLTVPGIVASNFQVQWRGFVTAPQSGQYTFSASPIRAAFLQSVFHDARQSMTVRVNDVQVLSTSSDNWRPSGTPVALTGGSATPIEITFSYQRQQVPQAEYPPVAQLLWEGPALPRQPVAASALAPLEGDGQGLTAVYTGAPAPVQQIDRQVHFAWLTGRTLATSPSAAALDALWSKATDSEYLAQCEADAALAGRHPLLTAPSEMAELLPADRQVSWLELVQQHPDLLRPLSLEQAVELYAAYRFASPDDALGVLGQWILAHGDLLPEFTHHFAQTNRRPYKQLADMMSWQYAPHGRLLEDQYVTGDSGECYLPGSYALTFVYTAGGNWSGWESVIGAHIQANPPASDLRAQWLLARAMAQEVRLSSDNRYEAASVFPLQGEGFLQQALEAAVSEPMRLRVYGELVVRYASQYDFAEARRLAIEAAGELTSPASAAEISRWQAQIDRLEAGSRLDQELQAFNQKWLYRESLEEYLQTAQQHGDQRSIDLYQQLLEQPIE